MSELTGLTGLTSIQ